ncbi:hypothetical protein AX15_007933 [Amanita polypyramis BW_CC]|nr:hypothetical protein AX15_007933 [Amanita polypyramis BW_CC]
MDTSEDFTNKSFETYHTTPMMLSSSLHDHMARIQNNIMTENNVKGKGKEEKMRQHTPIQVLSNGQELLDFMDIVVKNLTREDQVQFRKELAAKNYMARSTYLKVMLDGLFRDAIDTDLHQGHYKSIGRVYDNFNDPLEKFEDQVESVEKDKMLFVILPYELYGDLLVHWLVTRKYIYNACNIPSDSSMEKITWSYINALFDHRFKDTLSENDFLTIV